MWNTLDKHKKAEDKEKTVVLVFLRRRTNDWASLSQCWSIEIYYTGRWPLPEWVSVYTSSWRFGSNWRQTPTRNPCSLFKAMMELQNARNLGEKIVDFAERFVNTVPVTLLPGFLGWLKELRISIILKGWWIRMEKSCPYTTIGIFVSVIIPGLLKEMGFKPLISIGFESQLK